MEGNIDALLEQRSMLRNELSWLKSEVRKLKAKLEDARRALTWRERIDLALAKMRRGEDTYENLTYFTNADLQMAASFRICAVGEKAHALNESMYADLYVNADLANHLGMEFVYAVEDNKVEQAENIYNQIQELELVSLDEQVRIRAEYQQLMAVEQDEVID